MKKFLKNILNKTKILDDGPKPYFKVNNIKLNNLNDQEHRISFGNKNPEKIFYIIRRSPGAGLFSNVISVLNHLKICEDNKYIPYVDMENFLTIYNENLIINGTFNAWEYYFKKVSNYTLSEIYDSKNVIISSNVIRKNFEHWPNKNKVFKKIYNKYIYFKDDINNKAHDFCISNYIETENTLGIHFRGTSYKKSAGHHYPGTIEQFTNIIENLLKNYNFTKIFLVTEETNYLNNLKKRFKNKICYIDSYRSNIDDAFNTFPRSLHRYKLGEESVLESIILSKCRGILYVSSNIVHFSNLISNNNQKLFELYNGLNSKNQFLANFKWYIKKHLPYKLFGLKNKIIIH
jgi:hypothetical protein